MSRRHKSVYNTNLAPLPSFEEIAQAMVKVEEDGKWGDREGMTATRICMKLDIDRARRHGRGAVAYSWTGDMAPALRLSPRLKSMEREGLVEVYRFDYKNQYTLTEKGRKLATG